MVTYQRFQGVDAQSSLIVDYDIMCWSGIPLYSLVGLQKKVPSILRRDTSVYDGAILWVSILI